MNCPKCNAESYLLDEEFAYVAEKVSPAKLVVRATYVCKSCHEKFTRIEVHDLESKTSGREYKGTGAINRILGETNFPSSQTQADASVLDDFGDLMNDNKESPLDRPRATNI